MKGIEIEFEDGLVYKINKMNIASSARRFTMYDEIMALELDKFNQNQKLSAASLICCLYGADNNLVYPGDISEIDKMYEEMDMDIFNLLCETMMEVNPPNTKGMKAKKKTY